MPSCRSSSSWKRRSTLSRRGTTDARDLWCLSFGLVDAWSLLEFVSRAMHVYNMHGGSETQHADSRMYIHTFASTVMHVCSMLAYRHSPLDSCDRRQLRLKLCGETPFAWPNYPHSLCVLHVPCSSLTRKPEHLEGVWVVQLPSTHSPVHWASETAEGG